MIAMRGYKIESYLPEESFYQGKDARFWRAVFEDCFVVDLHNGVNVIASCRGTGAFAFSAAQMATLLTLFNGSKEFLILPSSRGTLLVYPAWPHLELALAFLLNESPKEVQKAYENAQRYAFSALFDASDEPKNNRGLNIESKLCTLQFYMDALFGAKRQTNAVAHILMIANLVGCHLQEMSISRVKISLDEQKLDRLGAYLFCTFMTMRRYNGKVSALPDREQTHANLQHVSQEYGLRIEQSIKERIAKPTAFDLPSSADVASFAKHPIFKDYIIDENDGAISLHIPLRQKALLSSVSMLATGKELMLTLFPFSKT